MPAVIYLCKTLLGLHDIPQTPPLLNVDMRKLSDEELQAIIEDGTGRRGGIAP